MKTQLSHPYRSAWLFAFLLVSTALHAQVNIVYGKGELRKRKGYEVDYYVDTISHRGSRKISGPCGSFHLQYHHPVHSITMLHNIAVVYSGSKYFFERHQVCFLAEGQDYLFHDTLLWVWSKHNVQVFGLQSDNPLALPPYYENQSDYKEIDCLPHTVQGMQAFCLPWYQWEKGRRFYEDIEELHTWGMLGKNGKWLIEPKFDGPFRFEGGIAEVIYYGEKRKINEKGEFVE